MELLNVGGNANNRSQCGLSYANSNNGFSNSRTNIGARLNYYTRFLFLELRYNLHCSSQVVKLRDSFWTREHMIEPVSMEGYLFRQSED